jgi:hypothetical protein
LRFSQPWLWKVSSSGTWRRVIRWVSTDVSEEHIASIFRVEEIGSANQQASRWLAWWTYFFGPEDGGDTFLRNVGWISTDYTASYPKRWYSLKILLSCTCLLPASNWPVCCTVYTGTATGLWVGGGTPVASENKNVWIHWHGQLLSNWPVKLLADVFTQGQYLVSSYWTPQLARQLAPCKRAFTHLPLGMY